MNSNRTKYTGKNVSLQLLCDDYVSIIADGTSDYLSEHSKAGSWRIKCKPDCSQVHRSLMNWLKYSFIVDFLMSETQQPIMPTC